MPSRPDGFVVVESLIAPKSTDLTFQRESSRVELRSSRIITIATLTGVPKIFHLIFSSSSSTSSSIESSASPQLKHLPSPSPSPPLHHLPTFLCHPDPTSQCILCISSHPHIRLAPPPLPNHLHPNPPHLLTHPRPSNPLHTTTLPSLPFLPYPTTYSSCPHPRPRPRPRPCPSAGSDDGTTAGSDQVRSDQVRADGVTSDSGIRWQISQAGGRLGGEGGLGGVAGEVAGEVDGEYGREEGKRVSLVWRVFISRDDPRRLRMGGGRSKEPRSISRVSRVEMGRGRRIARLYSSPA